MKLPEDTNLPLFAYGLFKPGQLGYYRIDDKIKDTRTAEISAKLYDRDGVPIIFNNSDSHHTVVGELIKFEPDQAESGYRSVNKIEPDKQYRWEKMDVRLEDNTKVANVLHGKNPSRGTSELGTPEWDGSKDPLFTDALELINDIIESNNRYDGTDNTPLFKIQMAYFLLWSSIERYISLRYGIGTDKTIRDRYSKMSEEPAFKKGLNQIELGEARKKQVIRTDRPRDDEKLDKDNPRKSLDYYYQVRSNAIHRGKSAHIDFELLRNSLIELHTIFKDYVLTDAFSRHK